MGEGCRQANGEEVKHHQSESQDLEEEGEDVEAEMIGVTGAEAEAAGSHAVCQRAFPIDSKCSFTHKSQIIPTFTTFETHEYAMTVVS